MQIIIVGRKGEKPYFCGMMKENKKVLLGMSGGTDSSISAMRLLEEGYEVTGVTFRFYEPKGDTTYLEEARSLAAQLGIEHITCDARQEFARRVVSYFVREYMEGRTPVPCVLCNNFLKWPLLAQLADERGIFHLSTGHYVQTRLIDGKYYIAPAVDEDKDQSFFLWGLPQEILKRMLLPMGQMRKMEARAWAAAQGFERVAAKKDSLGICFCPTDYRDFLKEALAGAGGDEWQGAICRGRFVDEQGTFLGWHEGYPYYTVGQRRGLGIHLNRPVFVREICRERNEIVLAPLHSLEKMEIWLKGWNIVDEKWLLEAVEVMVRIRYRKQENACTVAIAPDGRLHVRLVLPVTAVAPGQAAAFYNKEGLLLGGGIIDASR